MKQAFSFIASCIVFSLFSQLLFAADPQSTTLGDKTRIAIVGLNHDHVWGLLKDIAKEPQADLVAIADDHADLVSQAKAQVPGTVKFYPDYIKMLDEAKPEAVL
jgi:hypothetical protein